MIDDRREELASLYAFDLLDREEDSRFRAELERDHSLRKLASELRSATGHLAYLAPPAAPPPELKSRVIASIGSHRSDERVVRPAPGVFRPYLPWAIAASLALATVWQAQSLQTTRTESALLREQLAVTELTTRAARTQNETERLLAQKELAFVQQQISEAATQLAEVRSRLSARDREVARLTDDLKTQGDLAQLKITALASMLKNSPQALAVAVWNPSTQEGVLKVEKLPALLPGQDYQLWVVDPQYRDPVDGGVFNVDPANGEARVNFKARQRVASVSAFAVTLERKGGVPKAEGPFVLLGK